MDAKPPAQRHLGVYALGLNEPEHLIRKELVFEHHDVDIEYLEVLSALERLELVLDGKKLVF